MLLIVAALAGRVGLAARYELDVLCEVHDAEELRRALDTGCGIIGVNNRDLKTFKVDLGTALRLAEKIPSDALAVAESGIESGADIARLRAAGYGAFLIGETLMKAERPGEACGTRGGDYFGVEARYPDGDRRKVFLRFGFGMTSLINGNKFMTWVKIAG